MQRTILFITLLATIVARQSTGTSDRKIVSVLQDLTTRLEAIEDRLEALEHQADNTEKWKFSASYVTLGVLLIVTLGGFNALNSFFRADLEVLENKLCLRNDELDSKNHEYINTFMTKRAFEIVDRFKSSQEVLSKKLDRIFEGVEVVDRCSQTETSSTSVITTAVQTETPPEVVLQEKTYLINSPSFIIDIPDIAD